MKLNKFMHSLSNRIASLVLLPMFFVGFYFIYRDAYNDLWRIIGIVTISLLFIFVMYLFLILFRSWDKLYFYEDKIVRVSIFKKEEFRYEDYIAVLGKYTSSVERKRAIILTPKKYDGAFTLVDTSRFGNVIQLNKMKVLYCISDDELIKFLNNKM